MSEICQADARIKLADAAVGLGAIVSTDALLVGLVYLCLKSDVGGAEILAWLPVLLVVAIAVPTAGVLAYLKRRGIPLGFAPLGAKGWHLLWQVPCAIALAGACAAVVGPLLGIEPKGASSTSEGGGIFMVLSLAAYLLLAPFLEEIVFRRILLGYFETRMPAAMSVVLSSLIFGALHVAPPVIVYATFLGIGCALATRWHQSLWAGLIVHMCNNVLVQLIAVAAL